MVIREAGKLGRKRRLKLVIRGRNEDDELLTGIARHQRSRRRKASGEVIETLVINEERRHHIFIFEGSRENSLKQVKKIIVK